MYMSNGSMERAGSSKILDKMPDLPKLDSSDRQAEDVKLKIWRVLQRLSFNWSLRLELPPPERDSPLKRLENPSLEQEIVTKIILLCWKRKIDPLIKQFEIEAKSRLVKWVNKPKAERGIVPERTRDSMIAITDDERENLLLFLRDILTEVYDMEKTPTRHSSLGGQNKRKLDDSPIPFSVSKPKSDCKRPRDQLSNTDGLFKKPKIPEAIGFAPSKPTSFETSRSANGSFASYSPSIFSNPQFNVSANSLAEVFTQETVPTQECLHGKTIGFDAQAYRDPLTTSFQSNLSNTQISEFDDALNFDPDLVATLDSKLVRIGRSDPIVDEELSQDMVDQAEIIDENSPVLADFDELDSWSEELRSCLQQVFPKMPMSLRNLPLYVAYEIARVFLHTDVSFEEFKVPETNMSIDYTDYDALWTFLKGLPCFQEKSFPPRCSRQVWSLVVSGDSQGASLVPFMVGSLRFNWSDNKSATSPLFRLQLHPLSLDHSHRLVRRFGRDRFFELEVPDLEDRHIPKILRRLGSRGTELVIEWLVDECHQFLDRIWKPFYVKPKDRSKRKTVTTQKSTADPEPIHRVTFFAIDGMDFVVGPIPLDCSAKPPVKISIETLLNRIRPTRKNTSQSVLKLFSRTALALSRNIPTILLETSQIRFRKDILYEEEVMTDGGGRISPTLAVKVTQVMKLNYMPSAFQGRLGEAKGLWTVDHHDQSGDDWIEVFESQQKWTRSTRLNGESDDISHRTFEVLDHSVPLKSAALNLQFLPILMDRAKSRNSMCKAITQILEHGLHREIANLGTAMETPQSFRKWIRDTRPNMKERVYLGAVEYEAGLPKTLEERMNALLDAGFNAKKLLFMKEMARTIFKNKCNDLKERMNITIGSSTNAFMVPDYAGVLEPGEVYIDLSSFIDMGTGLPGPLMNGVDILVARSPAHFVSDVQKVKAVLKVEFMGLRDVIVFPTKGKPSLAAKLSGGDYDGDRAWVCWEKSLVDNFTSADIPPCPNLVKEGYIRKDSTTYQELVEGHSDPTSIFLKRAFSFNMRPSLLGKCTYWKEEVCYAQGSVNTEEAVFLSTLLALLVDQAKQGYIFTEEDRLRIQREKIKIRTQKPLYKTDIVDPRAKHIVDRLKYVANATVEKALTDFHQGFPDPPLWDEHLIAFYRWAQTKAKSEELWAKLLGDLDADIKALKSEWAVAFDRKDESKPDFVPIKLLYHERFQAIQPHEDTTFAQALSLDCFPDPDISGWSLLKASALFASYKPKYVKNAVWWLAGRQLCSLKAIWTGNMTVVAPHMYAILGPISGLVKALDGKEPADTERSDDPDDVDDND